MTYEFKTQPWTHQREAMSRAWKKRGYAYLMEMGCVDRDTEYLSPTGWHKISEYSGGQVAQFTLDGCAQFVDPMAYVVKPCDEFYHFHTSRGTDQMLSADHRILFCGATKTHRSEKVGEVPDGFLSKDVWWHRTWRETSPRKLGTKMVHYPTMFHMDHGSGLNLTDDEIRVQVAFHADGSYGTRDLSKVTRNRHGGISVKNNDKKVRIRMLLEKAGIPYKERPAKGGEFALFVFFPPLISKTFGPEWWNCTYAQRKIVAEEVSHWDGHFGKADGRSYGSSIESDVDFVQYCMSSTGLRAHKTHDPGLRSGREIISTPTWYLHVTGSGRSSNIAMMYFKEKVPSIDGKMYCFSVPSGYLVFRRNGCVFVSGNTGKSKVAVDEASLYFEEKLIDGWVVIAPKGVYENWIRKEIPDHMPDRVRSETMIVRWRGGHGKSEKAELEQLVRYRKGLAVLVMNVEALSSSDSARAYLTKFLCSHKCMMHLDESTTIKTPGAARTKAVKRIGSAAHYRRIMTGSPVTRGPLDLYSQFDFLDEGLLGCRSFYAFRARYSVMQTKFFGGRKVLVPVANRNLDELAERMKPHSFRVTKDECLDLPPKIFETRNVELTLEQTKMYASLRENALAMLDSGEMMTATHVLTQMLRLQQLVCGQVTSDDGVVQDVPSNRVQAVLDVAEETDGKIIVWSRFRRDIEKLTAALAKVYGPDSVAQYHGGNTDTRQGDVQRFLTKPECRFMLSNQQSGGYGNTWIVARTMIYFSNDFSLERRIQSEDRAHRAGQTGSVTYVDLVSPGTVDEKIADTLRARMDVATAVTGDKVRDWI